MAATNVTFGLASTNQGKIREVRAIFADTPFSIRTISDDIQPLDALDVAETANTFEGNAQLKAQAFATHHALPMLADDSGLEIDAFNGWPGVHSNRWLDGTPAERNAAVLKKMSGLDERGAQFTTVVCFIDPQQSISEYFTGIIRGTIARNLRGDRGFGYDPIFIPEDFSSTFAEMEVEEKNAISHRKKAFAAAKSFLVKQYNEE